MKETKTNGILYVVATPIGNLKDITLRAIEVLKEVDIVACEDTRVTGKLLAAFDIKKPLFSFHQHSHEVKISDLIDKLDKGTNIALVTDSGTPGISDPGAKLVKRILDYGKIKLTPPKAGHQGSFVGRGCGSAASICNPIKIVSIPGPSALSAALSISGVSSKNILFLGFLPHKKRRNKKLAEIEDYWKKGLTIVFFESPFRIKKTLKEIVSRLDEAEITVLREITKKFEEVIHIHNDKKEKQIENIIAKGEFTVVIRGK